MLAEVLPAGGPAPLVWGLLLWALATAIGITPVKKMIHVREARHELRHGSAGWLRGIGGWSIIAFWLIGTWFLATVVGDWAVSGDLGGAMQKNGVWRNRQGLMRQCMARHKHGDFHRMLKVGGRADAAGGINVEVTFPAQSVIIALVDEFGQKAERDDLTGVAVAG